MNHAGPEPKSVEVNRKIPTDTHKLWIRPVCAEYYCPRVRNAVNECYHRQLRDTASVAWISAFLNGESQEQTLASAISASSSPGKDMWEVVLGSHP